jgi:hypothetical protein
MTTKTARKPNTRMRQYYIRRLREFYAEHGRTPTAKECGAGSYGKRHRDRNLPDYSSICYHFGTFRAAVEAAELPVRPHGLRADKDRHDDGRPKRKRVTRRRVAPLIPEWRSDFLLALPELRLELARALEYDGSIHVGQGPASPPQRRRSV